LTAEDRRAISAKLAQLRDLATTAPSHARNEKLAAVARMLMAYPMANASEEAGAARAGAYLDALDDVPPAAIAEAVRRWNRGEAGEGLNYSFAPAPAILRKLALKAVEPLLQAIRDLEQLQGAVSLDEAMTRKAAEQNPLIPKLKRA
jgi:hypothetical protein